MYAIELNKCFFEESFHITLVKLVYFLQLMVLPKGIDLHKNLGKMQMD